MKNKLDQLLAYHLLYEELREMYQRNVQYKTKIIVAALIVGEILGLGILLL